MLTVAWMMPPAPRVATLALAAVNSSSAPTPEATECAAQAVPPLSKPHAHAKNQSLAPTPAPNKPQLSAPPLLLHLDSTIPSAKILSEPTSPAPPVKPTLSTLSMMKVTQPPRCTAHPVTLSALPAAVVTSKAETSSHQLPMLVKPSSSFHSMPTLKISPSTSSRFSFTMVPNKLPMTALLVVVPSVSTVAVLNSQV